MSKKLSSLWEWKVLMRGICDRRSAGAHLCEGIIFRKSLCNFWRNARTVCNKWTLYVMWIRDLYIQNDAWPGFVLWCNIFCRKILVAMYLNLLYCIKNPVDVSFVAIFIQTFVNYLILTLACLSIYLPWKCTFGTQSRVCRCRVTLERNLDQKMVGSQPQLQRNFGPNVA